MDQELRHLERRAKLSDDNLDWDSYIAALIRVGKIDGVQNFLGASILSWGQRQAVIGEVTFDKYQVLTRYISYQCRNEAFRLRAFEVLFEMLQSLPHRVDVYRAIKPKRRATEGYYWIFYEKNSLLLGGIPQYLPQWHPIKLRSFSAPPLAGCRSAERLVVPCPVCAKEGPIRYRLTHLRTHLHAL